MGRVGAQHGVEQLLGRLNLAGFEHFDRTRDGTGHLLRPQHDTRHWRLGRRHGFELGLGRGRLELHRRRDRRLIRAPRWLLTPGQHRQADDYGEHSPSARRAEAPGDAVGQAVRIVVGAVMHGGGSLEGCRAIRLHGCILTPDAREVIPGMVEAARRTRSSTRRRT
ncbi:MAG TPA: hypothetical protein PKA84_01005 [Rubrivivax sp.]|nr:hypothetical protein [Rubrivivax sp.]HMR68786.1 hypothetical protein [Rubrivivax sp.]